jgi:ribosomal protein S18 acetylase RimI-like enzyme
MDTIRCRRAGAADVAEMALIREAGGWAGGADARRMGLYLAGEHHPQHALAERVVYVAERSGAMIGFIAGHRTTRFGCDGELQWLFVLPEHRGSGAADRLLDELAAWFVGAGAHRVCVNVEPENERARRFYERRGAKPMSEHWMDWPEIGEARSGAVM